MGDPSDPDDGGILTDAEAEKEAAVADDERPDSEVDANQRAFDDVTANAGKYQGLG